MIFKKKKVIENWMLIVLIFEDHLLQTLIECELNYCFLKTVLFD